MAVAVVGGVADADQARTGCGSAASSGSAARCDARGLVRSLGRRVGHVGGGEVAHPAGELEQDAVGVLEVDAAHEHARVHGVADAPFGVVVVGDFGAGDAGGDEAVAVLLDLLGRHVEGDMVHGADRARQLTLIGARRRRADAGHPVGRVGEPEEGETVATAAVEEEVLPHAGRQLDRLDQRHAEDVRVEVDGPLHVAAHEREMVDAPQLESACVGSAWVDVACACHEPALPRRRRTAVTAGRRPRIRRHRNPARPPAV